MLYHVVLQISYVLLFGQVLRALLDLSSIILYGFTRSPMQFSLDSTPDFVDSLVLTGSLGSPS